jgi:hypothetical protein
MKSAFPFLAAAALLLGASTAQAARPKLPSQRGNLTSLIAEGHDVD